MALKLAGEEWAVVLGLDDAGWLREIEASDSSPALAINQSGSGLHLKVGSGTPGRSPQAYFGGRVEIDGDLCLDGGIGTHLDMNGYNIERCDKVVGREDIDFILRSPRNNVGVGICLQTKNAAGADTTRLTVDSKAEVAAFDFKANLIKNAKGVLQCVKKTVNYNDASPVIVFAVPVNTAIADVLVEVTTAFVGTSPALDIGDGSDADGFLPNLEISPTTAGWKGEEADTKGVYLWDATDKHTIKRVYGAATNVIATIGGSGLTAGVANVYVYYLEMA